MATIKQVPPLSIRLPLEIREYLEAEAQKNWRSLTNEVVKRLTESIELEKQERMGRLHGSE